MDPVTLIIVVALVLLLIGALPSWPHSKGWGNGPWGIILVILLVIVLFRFIR